MLRILCCQGIEAAEKFSADLIKKTGIDPAPFASSVHVLQQELTKFHVLLVEAYLVWSLNNRTHELAATLMSQQVATVAAGKNGITPDMLPKALYSKALEGQR